MDNETKRAFSDILGLLWIGFLVLAAVALITVVFSRFVDTLDRPPNFYPGIESP